MPLTTGHSLSFYEILGPLGAGGMGEVYRARDTRLEREVAIKVLPEHFAEDEERLKRFEREAKTLATLHHPNVASIFGIDQEGDTCFLALELVPGEDLATRLARGRLPLDEAIDVCRQIAEGLEAAHEAGVVHRDLKPANVRVTPDGVVKILDFGLAKPIGPTLSPGGETTSAQSDSFLVTSEGMILGTPTYMSPEQARGRPVDKRTDIWAFGCVLFECLTGKRAFEGEAFGDLVAAILERDVDAAALSERTPRRVRELVARCLAKDPRQRLRDAGEARVMLEQPYAELVDAKEEAVGEERGDYRRSRSVAGVVAAVVTAGLGAFFAGRSLQSQTHLTLRSEIGLSPRVSKVPGGSLKLLSGGHRILFAGEDGGESHLWLRDLSELSAVSIPGTGGAELAGVSPDGAWYAFFAERALKKISVNGGDPVVLAEATHSGRGGSWSEDGYIYYAPGPRHPIMRVHEDGGEPERVTDLGTGTGASTGTWTGARITSHRWPTALPGGKALLYLAGTGGDFAEARIEVRELESGEVRVLQSGAIFPRYFDDHIGFVRDGAINVQGFDAKTLELTTPPVPLISDVSYAYGNGGAQFSISDNGTLIYIPGLGSGALEFEMKWTGEGAPSATLAGPDAIFHPRFSPDGGRIAYTVGLGAETDVWILDVESEQKQRLTLGSKAKDRWGAWSPDGRLIAFASNRDGGALNLYHKPSDGSGEAVRLTTSDYDQAPTSWSSDGRMILFMQSTPDRGTDLHLLHLDTGGRPVGEPEVFESTLGHDIHAAFSPDDRFVAYVVEEGSKANVFVRDLAGTSQWQISDDGGFGPRWSDGGSLYYRNWQSDNWHGLGGIYRVDFSAENDTRMPGLPVKVVSGSVEVIQLFSTMFDVHPVDERFIVIDTAYDPARADMNPVLIQNWVDDLPGQRRR